MTSETPGAAPTPGEVLEAVNTLLAHNAELHRSRGSFFLKRLGFGRWPALLNIDLANMWTQAGSAYACDGMDEMIPGVQRLLAVARARGIPIFFTTMAYAIPSGPSSDAGLLQHKWATELFPLGLAEVEIDERLARQPDEHFIVKKRASAFHGTYLSGALRSAGVDTVIVTGVTASGCIRNTVEDAIAEGFRPIVVRECIGDRVPGTVEWNLFDIDAKFADVESLDTVLEHLESLKEISNEAGAAVHTQAQAR